MSKTVKLEDAVYNRLDTFQQKHETKSQAISRLLDMLEKVGELRSILEGQVNFREWQKEQLQQEK